jgi:hypothetical protein
MDCDHKIFFWWKFKKWKDIRDHKYKSGNQIKISLKEFDESVNYDTIKRLC